MYDKPRALLHGCVGHGDAETALFGVPFMILPGDGGDVLAGEIVGGHPVYRYSKHIGGTRYCAGLSGRSSPAISFRRPRLRISPERADDRGSPEVQSMLGDGGASQNAAREIPPLIGPHEPLPGRVYLGFGCGRWV